ncbi:transposase [Janthinobacterium sp. 64]|nr:transposase [Janthinobacterium sp. 64]
MSGKRYTEEFKVVAVKQVVDRGHPAAEVAERLGVSIHSIYAWTPTSVKHEENLQHLPANCSLSLPRFICPSAISDTSVIQIPCLYLHSR